MEDEQEDQEISIMTSTQTCDQEPGEEPEEDHEACEVDQVLNDGDTQEDVDREATDAGETPHPSSPHPSPPPHPSSPHPSTPPHPSSPHPSPHHESEPCWYCLRSQDADFHPQQEESQPLPLPPSGGQKVNYQTDPRPHFGVACSSHSPCRPLWGSEGPNWGQRAHEDSQKTEMCPHCHLGLPADTLLWHEAKCQLFDGMKTPKK